MNLLQNLDISSNFIESIDDCEELAHLPSLSHLDMKTNQIDDRDKIIPFFERIQTLRALYLKGNPCQRHMSMYRKNLTAHLKNLNYLDDRPVFDSERIFADAWLQGGAEGEREAKRQYQAEHENKKKKHLEVEREKWAKTRTQRKEYMQRMIDELKGKKNDLINKRDALKEEYKIMLDTDPEKEKKLNAIKLVEQELRSDYIRALEERGEDVPSAVPSSAEKLNTDVIDREFKESIKVAEERIA